MPIITADKAKDHYDVVIVGSGAGGGQAADTLTLAGMEGGMVGGGPGRRGGRETQWGRRALRNGPYDFKPRERAGLGFDGPFTYEEIEPYYTKVETLIGVYGSNEGLENTPNSPDGVLLPPPRGRA